MAFHFSLHAVLHLYQSIEHQQELRLRAANQQVAKVRHMIELVDAQKQLNRSQQSTELQSGTTGAELEFARATEMALNQRRGALEAELMRAQHFRDEQQRAFRQAHRRRETLSTLRESQLQQYRHEAARREQRQVDDAFLMRRNPSA
jgi:flagellar export protein FliJ